MRDAPELLTLEHLTTKDESQSSLGFIDHSFCQFGIFCFRTLLFCKGFFQLYTFMAYTQQACPATSVTPIDFNGESQAKSGPHLCSVSNRMHLQLASLDHHSTNGWGPISRAPVAAVTLTSNSSGLLLEDVDFASLHCAAQGQAANFTWKLNGEPLPPDHRYVITQENSPPNSNLTISPVTRNDTGPFTCTATNATTNATSNALNLSLAWTPDTLDITCLSQFYNPYIQLSCFWMGGQPAANVTMTFNGTKETAQSNVTRNVNPTENVNQSILICNGDHLGVISSCNLTLENPQSTSHNNSAITSVKQGENTVLTVILQQGPYAQFTWSRLNPDPVPVPTGGKYSVESDGSRSNLHISEVTVNENGTYECVAKSAIGSTSFTFNLDVTQVTDSTQNGLSGGEIAGIVIGVLAGVALIGVIVFFIIKKK
ncbi:cell adhesion molecule CEACAM1-like [Rhinoderma darwinii]|uniref:cell adhesion molecule CEACAM1-like n=1 Tax=Rhinoderma darwinii TaxID=43563 RepID=UPI003F672786